MREYGHLTQLKYTVGRFLNTKANPHRSQPLEMWDYIGFECCDLEYNDLLYYLQAPVEMRMRKTFMGYHVHGKMVILYLN